MKYGVSVDDTYSGPQIAAVEFRMELGKPERNRRVLDSLYGRFGHVSFAAPTFLPSSTPDPGS